MTDQLTVILLFAAVTGILYIVIDKHFKTRNATEALVKPIEEETEALLKEIEEHEAKIKDLRGDYESKKDTLDKLLNDDDSQS